MTGLERSAQFKTHISPGNGEGQVADVAILDVDGQPELVECLLLELQVLQADVSTKQRDREILAAQAFDVALEIAVEHRAQHRLETANTCSAMAV